MTSRSAGVTRHEPGGQIRVRHVVCSQSGQVGAAPLAGFAAAPHVVKVAEMITKTKWTGTGYALPIVEIGVRGHVDVGNEIVAPLRLVGELEEGGGDESSGIATGTAHVMVAVTTDELQLTLTSLVTKAATLAHTAPELVNKPGGVILSGGQGVLRHGHGRGTCACGVREAAATSAAAAKCNGGRGPAAEEKKEK